MVSASVRRFAVYSADHHDQLPLHAERWGPPTPSGSGLREPARDLSGIFKDLGYIPDPGAFCRGPSERRVLEEVRLVVYFDDQDELH